MMNWEFLGSGLHSNQIFSAFFDSMPPEKIVSADGGSGEDWHCCLYSGQWRVERIEKENRARIVDTARRICVCDTEIELYKSLKKLLLDKIGLNGPYREGLALILSGGGAKGAYQIGVWNALCMLNIFDRIKAISGTSIGAVNAALFAYGNYRYAQKLWTDMSLAAMRADNFEKTRALYKRKPLAIDEILLKDHFLSQRELHHALARTISGWRGEKIRERCQIYTTAVSKDAWENRRSEASYIPWDILSNADMVKAALASSAVPLVYAPVKFQGKLYYDGGLVDNVPIAPLYRCGYRRFIVVHLNKGGPGKAKVPKKLEEYSDCRMIHIVPGDDFEDDWVAMLTLTPEITSKRIRMGREDTLALRDELLNLARL